MTRHATEAQEQRAVVDYCDWKRIPVFHIPNGGYRNKAEAARLKAQGVKAGVPDLFIPLPRGPYHGLFIEMKSLSGRASPEQLEWIERLDASGYMAKVCHGADEAIALVERYMSLYR